jgi:predicted CXXCH cytochrome family protein
MRTHRVSAVALSALLFLATSHSAYAATNPPRPARALDLIRTVLGQGPHAGDCERCHTMHSGNGLPESFALVGPDDNSLCSPCHSTPWAGGSLPDPWTYARSSHGSDPNAVWPGPDPMARTEPDAAGKCVNCHDPHGWTDAQGTIPVLEYAREEALCLRCHDGSPATTNVALDFAKPFTHPIALSGIHADTLETTSDAFGAAPENRRHAECEDCHNPHVAAADPLPPSGANLSRANFGVSRVRAVQGGAGAPPSYFFIPPSDTLTTPRAEYQLCYKCHSSWTVQPPGQTDLALVLNPANPSYHPVEAAGADPTIALASFAPGWTSASQVRCGDCHGSDFGTSRSPHGSNYRYILRKPYVPSTLPRIMDSDELCFTCHAWSVYGDPSAPETVRAASRFNGPAVSKGHAEHTAASVPCGACHVTHGSTTQKHLIVVSRTPGIISFTETPTGGTCTPTCHGPDTYAVNYAR